MNRDAALRRILSRREPWDIAVIGGGATGIGVALDAASRGYAVCLLEMSDFGKGTSSRSTKLIHGGVRYLQQGNVALVMEALRERGILRRNAPHLVHDLQFIVPNYAWWEAPFYGIGMKVYDLLAGKYGFGQSRHLSREEVLGRIPTLETQGLRGGVLYHDGQFDDARLLIDLAQTAEMHGAALLNYAPVTGLPHDDEGYINGLEALDAETQQRFLVPAKCVVNATGAFSDGVRRMDDPSATPLIAPSQGVHLVLERAFLPGDAAIMVPRTSDGRVMFAIPWHDHTLLGTTDTAIEEPSLEPWPREQEIDFILQTAGQYLARPPKRGDILSVFTGIRPLVKAESTSTAALSREHTIQIGRSGLLTIAGGKWTTYRRMARDCVDHAADLAQLPERTCVTEQLPIGRSDTNLDQVPIALMHYGAAASAVAALAAQGAVLGRQLHPRLPVIAAQVVWAARREMARTVDDVLARRTRALFLNARAALEMAAEVARLLAEELGRDGAWEAKQVADFQQVAAHYLPR